MGEVIPTVFARNKKEFDERFSKIVKISKKIHIDFMDGKFVKGKSVSLKEIENLKKYKKFFEAHLMVSDPDEWIEGLKKRGFKKIIVHYEAFDDLKKVSRVVFEISNRKMEPWLAFNPSTDFQDIIVAMNRIYGIKGILIMGVNPGKEGQELQLNVLRRIMNLKKEFKKIGVQIDGGVNEMNMSLLKRAGVDVVNSGSFIWKAKNPKEALEILRKKFS